MSAAGVHPPASRDGFGDDQASALRRLIGTPDEQSPRGIALATAQESHPRPGDQPPHLRLRAATHLAEAVKQPAPIRRHCPILCVTSGKGGVGKTCIAVNLAASLAAIGLRATLVDADLGLANAHLLCGLSPSRPADPPTDFRAAAVDAPGGFRLIPGSSGIAEMADLDRPARRAMVLGLLELTIDSDVLILDTSAGVGATVRNFALASDYVLLVTTPDPTAMADAYAILKCLAHRAITPADAINRVGLLVNQAASVAEGRAVANRFRSVADQHLGSAPAIAGIMLRDPRMIRAIRARRPLVIDHPRAPAARSVADLATRVADLVTVWAQRHASV